GGEVSEATWSGVGGQEVAFPGDGRGRPRAMGDLGRWATSGDGRRWAMGDQATFGAGRQSGAILGEGDPGDSGDWARTGRLHISGPPGWGLVCLVGERCQEAG